MSMYYVEITLLPDIETPLNFLLGKVFHAIHHRLVELQDSDKTVAIGLSFPEYKISPAWLGGKIRLFANDDKLLDSFNVKKALHIYSDYVHLTSIRRVPDDADVYVRYRRYQPMNNAESLARRRAKREGISYEQAIARYAQFSREQCPFPFIKMKSDSTNESYSLFIRKDKATKDEVFTFNTYGMSIKGTVPEF